MLQIKYKYGILQITIKTNKNKQKLSKIPKKGRGKMWNEE